MSAPEPRCAGKAHPELASQQVTRPVFIVGIPRSGTTALSHLLARDRRHRSLLSWEATASTPPPAAATYDSDPRYLAAIEDDFDYYAVNPGFKAIHHDPPDMPVECLVILAQHFANLSFGTMYHPLMFSVIDVLLINKIDYLALSDFDVPALRQRVQRLNPRVQIFEISAKTGAGVKEWAAWLNDEVKQVITR
jgi:hypothetical protein